MAYPEVRPTVVTDGPVSAKFRSNSGGAPMQQFAAVQATGPAAPNAVYMPLHGFTAVDLGYQRGNAVSNIVNKFDEPANTGVFLSLFDQIWRERAHQSS